MVLLTALIRPLHQRFGSDIDIVTSGPWSQPLLQGQPGVGRIWTLRSRKMPYWLSMDQHRLVQDLRARGIGPTWFCDGNDAAWPLLARAGIEDQYIVAAKDHDLRPGEHATEQWRRLAQILPAALSAGDLPNLDAAGLAPGCYLDVFPAQRADLRRWLAARRLASVPLIAVQIGNKRTMRRGFKRLAVNSKYWPMERWCEVLRFLRAQHPQHAIVLLGTGPEYALNQTLAARAGIDNLHNAADDLPVARLIALLERAEALLTVDSGPAHAAAAVGCPQVVLFGKASPSLYRPRGVAGADVKLLTGQMDGEPSMLGISVRSVLAAWGELKRRAAGHAAYPA